MKKNFRLKFAMNAFIMAVMVNVVFIPHIYAQDKLIFSTFENSGLTMVEEPIIREAYKRLGFEIEIRQCPGLRALKMANEGEVDGEVARLEVIKKNYKNLIMIPVPIHYLKAVVFTKNVDFSVNGWESLKPYKAVTLRGYKYYEMKLKEYGVTYQLVNKYSQILKTLNAERHDIALLVMLDGLKTLKDLNMKEIRMLKPPLETFPTYHFVHKKHENLVTKLTETLQKLRDEGFIEKIEKKVIEDLTIR